MVHNVADITPAGTAKPLSVTRKPANWVYVVALAGNGAAMRVGDPTTGAASGMALAAGASFLFPAIGDTQYLDLAMIYVFGTTTDKISVIYGTH